MTAETLIEQFRHWASWSGDAVVLDTETTDLDGEIIELAIVGVRDQAVLFNQRFRPTEPVSPGAQAVHGIGGADLVGCPSFAAHWPRIRYLLWHHRTPLIYNKAFDLHAICRSLDRASPMWYANPDPATSDVRTGDPYSADYWAYTGISRRAECVMEAYAPLAGHWSEWHGSYTWAKLTDACEQRGVDRSDLTAHSALGDALATARLIHACAALDPADFPRIGHEEEEEEIPPPTR